MKKIYIRTALVSINSNWRYSNIGIDQIGGYLREKGQNVDLLYYHHRENNETILNDLTNRYDLIGFSVHSANIERCVRLCKEIKAKDRNVKIALGGQYITLFHQEFSQTYKGYDYLVLGDGENPLYDIIISLQTSAPLCSLSVQTPLLNKHRIPARNSEITWFPAMDYYEHDTPAHNRRKVHCLQTKNNICTGTCAFCTERKGSIFRKPIDSIIHEIEYVYTQFGIYQFFFTDDNIMDPNDASARHYIKLLCIKLKERKLPISIKCYIKAISFCDTKEDHELLDLMASVGFANMFIGLEAGNQRDLDLYHKTTTVEDNYTIIRLLKQHQIQPIIGFIFFNPYSTIESLRANYQFLLAIGASNPFYYAATFVSLQKYTALFNKAQRDGLLHCDPLDTSTIDYTFADKDVTELVLFVKNSLRPQILKLEYEPDTLCQNLEEYCKVNRNAAKYRPLVAKFQRESLEAIKTYFGKLYIENDLEYCRQKLYYFLNFYKDLEKKLLDIHWKIIDEVCKSD